MTDREQKILTALADGPQELRRVMAAVQDAYVLAYHRGNGQAR